MVAHVFSALVPITRIIGTEGLEMLGGKKRDELRHVGACLACHATFPVSFGPVLPGEPQPPLRASSQIVSTLPIEQSPPAGVVHSILAISALVC